VLVDLRQDEDQEDEPEHHQADQAHDEAGRAAIPAAAVHRRPVHRVVMVMRRVVMMVHRDVWSVVMVVVHDVSPAALSRLP
jgi:hypothetical protein